MNKDLRLVLTCPKGLELLLAEEATQLGLEPEKEGLGSVTAMADMADMYRFCLYSRLANRVLLELWQGPVNNDSELYDAVAAIDWSEHLMADGRLCVDFAGTNRHLRDERFSAVRCKDAVVDQFLKHGEQRPSVDRQQPDLRINMRLNRGQLRIALDLSGESLHRRGYRRSGGAAPLRENLAAAVLIRADWPAISAAGGALIDPMCGSATLLIEGALMAMGIAPGLLRRHWGFSKWLGHVPALWKPILEAARDQRAEALSRQWPEIRGYDAAANAITHAEQSIEQAGLRGRVRVVRKELAQFVKPTHGPMDNGLLVTNPPWGERLGDEMQLLHLYQRMGQVLCSDFMGWQAAILTANPDLGKRMGLRSHKQYQLHNGSLPAKLLLFNVAEDQRVIERKAEPAKQGDTAPVNLSPGAEMLANRLRKNQRKLERWLKRESISCYRVYDADLPEYAVAIDRYDDQLHIAEYKAPKDIPEEKTRSRLRDVLEAVSAVFHARPDQVVLKERRRQRGDDQYQRLQHEQRWQTVQEGPYQLLVNLHDYLDTGLFLDHRPLRRHICEQSQGERFLNLFCYTGTASVAAAAGGASMTVSVDLSKTYLNWAKRNLASNGFSEARHHTIHSDCFAWLEESRDMFDRILLDPPTFSNSKRTDNVLDVQRDHAQLIDLAMARLKPGGLLYFSNNRRGFQLDEVLRERYQVADRTNWSLDPDYEGRPRAPHQCWWIQHS